MKEIKNKIITKEDIKKIVLLINDYYSEMSILHKQYKEESQNYDDPRNTSIKKIVMSSKPTLEFSVKLENHTETQNDVNWFIDVLSSRSKEIELITVSYLAYYHLNTSNNESFSGQSAQESIHLTFREDYASVSFEYQNPHSNYQTIQENIEAIIKNAPESYDKTISKKYMRENIPSLSIGLLIGIILSSALYLICKFTNINLYINNFILSIYFIPVMFVLSSLIGLILPGKNHSLYRQLNIKKKYAGYNSTKKSNTYKDDISEFLDYCEVEIGKNYKHKQIREQIEKNYKKSIKIAIIETIIFIALFVVSYIF